MGPTDEQLTAQHRQWNERPNRETGGDVLRCEQCEAGVSRSASMALAIAEAFGIDRHSIEPVSRNWNAQPLNPWVYRLTREALEMEITQAEAERLKAEREGEADTETTGE